MARISTYVKDTDITKSDKLLGTDTAGGTKNYSLKDIAKYLGGSGVTGQFAVMFVNNTFNGHNSQQNGQMTVEGLSAGFITFATVTELIVSEFCFDKQESSLNRLNLFDEQKIIISQVDNSNNFGIYKVDSISQVGSSTLHKLSLTKQDASGNLTDKENYTISLLPEGADAHKELIFTASTFVRVNGALQFETINGSSMCYIDFEHNLSKFPSISAEQEGSPGQVALMPVKYINNNKVRVYFGGTTSGKIFAN